MLTISGRSKSTIEREAHGEVEGRRRPPTPFYPHRASRLQSRPRRRLSSSPRAPRSIVDLLRPKIVSIVRSKYKQELATVLEDAETEQVMPIEDRAAAGEVRLSVPVEVSAANCKPTSCPWNLGTSADSPVSMDSSMALRPAVTRPSTGTRSPGSTRSTSPARTLAVATIAVSCVDAGTALAALSRRMWRNSCAEYPNNGSM